MATRGDSTSGQSTPEYLTLQKNYSKLVLLVSMQPNEYCDIFFEKKFISVEIKEKISTINKTNREKAQEVMIEVMKRVELTTGAYSEFVHVLNSVPEDICQNQVVEELQKTLQDFSLQKANTSRKENQTREYSHIIPRVYEPEYSRHSVQPTSQPHVAG